MVFPEILFQKNHLILIGQIPLHITDNTFLLVVAIQAAEETAVHIHDGHVMPPLGLIVGRNGFLTIQPPVVFGVVVCGLDLQNSGGAVRQFYKVVHIRQHPGILRVLEHLFDLIDLVAGPVLEDLRHQRFQQVSHLQGHPVVLMVLDHGNVQLVIKQIPGRPPR